MMDPQDVAALRSALPLLVRGVESSDPTVCLFGEGWYLNLACPWSLITPAGRVGFEDPSLDDAAWELIGREVTSVRETDRGHVVFDFGAGYSVEVVADSDLEPWVFHTPDALIIGERARGVQ